MFEFYPLADLFNISQCAYELQLNPNLWVVTHVFSVFCLFISTRFHEIYGMDRHETLWMEHGPSKTPSKF